MLVVLFAEGGMLLRSCARAAYAAQSGFDSARQILIIDGFRTCPGGQGVERRVDSRVLDLLPAEAHTGHAFMERGVTGGTGPCFLNQSSGTRPWIHRVSPCSRSAPARSRTCQLHTCPPMMCQFRPRGLYSTAQASSNGTVGQKVDAESVRCQLVCKLRGSKKCRCLTTSGFSLIS